MANISVFRMDKKNGGDWHSVPANYLPLGAERKFDLMMPETIPNEPGVVVLGGGGLGRPDFAAAIKHLMRPDRKYKVIAWGLGADTITQKGTVLNDPVDMDNLLGYFDGMDEVGTRIVWDAASHPGPNYRWVPCASCLSPLFDELRATPIKRRICVFEHFRESVVQHLPRKSRVLSSLLDGYKFMNNRGIDIRAKLQFMAESEFVFTNSYHGVYWATLLGRKSVCFPFKNGLFSFRHAPAYVGNQSIETAMENAQTYPEALEECRLANLEFFDDMTQKYGDF